MDSISIETGEEEEMRQLAQNLDWDVEVTVPVYQGESAEITFKRK